MTKENRQRNPSVVEEPTVSVGDRIINGLKEFETALKDKEVITKRFTVRSVELSLEPQEYTANSVREIRDKMNVSQAIFAQLLGVTVYTVRSWEQGKRQPPKIARRLMDEFRRNPSRWVDMLTGAATETEVGV